MSVAAPELPTNTILRPLEPHGDDRGVFLELYRAEWETGVAPIQWNAVRSESGVVRGVHVHLRHDDYLTVPIGRAMVGLRDLRRGSPTEGLSALVQLDAERPAALIIPHGVAHGFYFPEPSVHVYAVTEYWDPIRRAGLPLGRPRAGDRVARSVGPCVGSRRRQPAAQGPARGARALAANLISAPTTGSPTSRARRRQVTDDESSARRWSKSARSASTSTS